jgi:UDP-N-acetylglucosamine diphosphorylase / glucose-1-phosphate thymidylyltransferase / UDP-N-acetylgalactosamine diphosphorylase / glucosamine-1-phosphate N-acetyltransferase / galactosamine-1-phosphate N-acetyltransferase
MKAVMFAAGRSTRTYPLTVERPKVLLPVLNKPIIKRNLEQLKGIVEEVIIIVGFRKELIIEAVGVSFQGMKISYVEQKEQKGTGHALLQAEKLIKERFIAMNGDDLYSAADIKKLLRHKNGALAKQVPDPERFGVYVVEGDRATRIVEKPKRFVCDLANIGCYIFEPSIFEHLHHCGTTERGECEVTDGVAKVIESSLFNIELVTDHWIPIGYPWDLLSASEQLIKAVVKSRFEGTVSKGATIDGTLVLGKGSVIKSGVVVEGTVIIGEDSEIGPNCYLRSGAVIGNHCKVGQAVEIKNSIIMDHSKVPHLSYVGDSVIGEHCNLGAGTITANLRHDGKNVASPVKGVMVDTGRRKLGTMVGDHVHTGIHTSIYPGRKLWPHTHTKPGEIVDKDKTGEG